MWQQFKYSNADGSRPYFVYTPQHYQLGTMVPLIVMLHGCTQTAWDFAKGTTMNELAEQYGFIALYPQQTRVYNPVRCWNWYSPKNQQRGKGEPASIAGIIQTVMANTERWAIDPRRVYAAGISAGGAMAVILAATYPDLIAAIGVHSGMEYQAASNVLSGWLATRLGGPEPLLQGEKAHQAMGTFSRPIPTIVFHGTNDKIAAPINSDQVVEQWMRTNNLASEGKFVASLDKPDTVLPGQAAGYPYLVSSWHEPGGNSVQAYWKIAGMGHAWAGGSPSGSYTDPLGPSASLAMYQFFQAHPLSGTQALVREQPPSPQRWSVRHLLYQLLDRFRLHHLLSKLVTAWKALVHPDRR